jgi:probable FeS assembly SUF system protein SufT
MAHRLLRDCPATAIPAGDVTTLAAGGMVEVAQTLGGNVTVRTASGLYRVDRTNVSAIEGLVLADESGAPAGEFSEQAVWDAMRTCFDPEIPVNIVDLGLIYDLSIERTPTGANAVDVKMTLTAPGCGMGPVIAEDARQKIAALPSVERAKVHIVWDPVWNPRMISEAGRKTLGLE